MRPPRPCRTTTIRLRPGPGCSAARPIVSRTAASVLVPSVLSPRLKTLMPGGFTPPVQIKSRLEGSRRGLPHRDQTRRPPSRRWRTGVWGPRPGPAERAGWGGGGARERMRDGRQAVPKRADFAATRPCRTTTIKLRPGPGCSAARPCRVILDGFRSGCRRSEGRSLVDTRPRMLRNRSYIPLYFFAAPINARNRGWALLGRGRRPAILCPHSLPAAPEPLGDDKKPAQPLLHTAVFLCRPDERPEQGMGLVGPRAEARHSLSPLAPGCAGTARG